MSLALKLPLVAGVDEELIDTCGETPSWFCEATWNLTHNRLLSRGADWMVARPLVALLVLAVAWLINRWMRRAVTAAISRFTMGSRLAAGAMERFGREVADTSATDARERARAATLSVVSRATVSSVIWTIAFLVVLGVFNLDLGPLLAGAGIAGLALGLGAQSLVKDCIAGFLIILEDQCGVGDEVDLGHAVGTVESLSLRMLRVRDADGTLWTVPNGAVVRVGNRTRSWSQGLVDVTIGQHADLDVALNAIDQAVAATWASADLAAGMLEKPAVLGVERIDAAGPVVRISVRTRPGAQWTVMRELRLAIVRSLAAQGVASKPDAPPDLPG